MAKSRCVLCEKEFGFFDRGELYFFGSFQDACSDCAKEYQHAEGEALESLSQRILSSPHLKDRERILLQMDREAARRKKAEAKRQAQTKFCPNCSTQMELKLEHFSIGADGGGGLVTLLADQYEVDLYACPQCGKVELYTAGFLPGAKEEEPETVVCPDCGTKHSPLINCPRCASKDPFRFIPSGESTAKRKAEAKPPWEK